MTADDGGTPCLSCGAPAVECQRTFTASREARHCCHACKAAGAAALHRPPDDAPAGTPPPRRRLTSRRVPVRELRRLDALRPRWRRVARWRGSRPAPAWSNALMVERWLRVTARHRDARLCDAARKVADAVGFPAPDPMTPAVAETLVTLAVLRATDPERFRIELGRLRFYAARIADGRMTGPIPPPPPLAP